MNLHGLHLPNRIWMSAMTRTRASDDNVPTILMAQYYAQRADAGLIVTECTAVSEQSKGIINGPGIWRQDQIAGWRRVTDAVHAAGGRIYCQLWHCGRVAHPDMRGGELPVAPSPLPAQGKFKFPDREADFPGANTGFDKDGGNRVIEAGEADAVAYGVLFLANPGLTERFQHARLNKPDPATFYGRGPKGYIDYPALTGQKASVG
jgi:2,4-dienoyl-CoA reductase-like NADH-dependent reductase (Old Yellow Enzyme family)